MKQGFIAVAAALAIVAVASFTISPALTTGQVDAVQFEKVKPLCDKNGGLDSAEYGYSSSLFNFTPHYRPTVAHCKDGAHFDVSKSIQRLNVKE